MGPLLAPLFGDVPIDKIPATEFIYALRFCGGICLFFTGLSMLMLLIYLGACNACPADYNPCPVHEDEPCPRAVRWSYPEHLEAGHRHWFLVHVAETKVLDQHYVASISQYVGARGTSGAKLMLMCCTAVAVCQVLTAFLLWRVEKLTSESHISFVRCNLMWLAAAALILLGLAESALDWKPDDKKTDDPPPGKKGTKLKPERSQMDLNAGENGNEDDPDHQFPRLTRTPSLRRTVSLSTDEDWNEGKSCLRVLHMLAAFAVVGLNVASQWAGDDVNTRPVSAALTGLGAVAFFVFCIMQWLSGANDEFIPEVMARGRGSVVAYGLCACLRPWCYCPPGFHHDPNIEARLARLCDDCGRASEKRSALICASWWFIALEMVAFIALTSGTAVEALTKEF